MAEISTSSTRPPLAEATNRVNASISVDQQGQKARLEAATTASEPGTSRGTPVARVNTSTRPEVRVTPSVSAPYTAASPTLKPPQEDVEAKRMSQASYESASSSRSKKPYKTHIGPWQLGKTLGKGSSARVRLCRHNLTQQLAAVKIVNRRMAYMVQDSSLAALNNLDKKVPKKTPGEMRVPMAIEREVAILKLIEHPHIMKIYDIWENRSEIYLILEYIEQGDLFHYINNHGRLSEEVALYFFRQIISAITYCHSFNICHRDLKPENILITSDGKIKIADFGMAALHQTDAHHLSTACGSPHYAAPELLKNRQYRGDKADIWSLGVILYAMLAATLPFDDPDMRLMMNKTKKGQYSMPKNLSPEAEDLIRCMLQVDPQRRITLAEIWRHPLVQKYQYLDDYGDNNGQPPDIRKGFQHNPVPRAEIDPQLLRQLRSMWHMFDEKDLALKLSCDEPNDQKAFYWLLSNYREKQLEDFKPEIPHSRSDYHHLKPGAWKKRVSTCEFSQPRADGPGRSISRFTAISTTADTESGTVRSYDPYRDNRTFQAPLSSQVSHAKVTIHRDLPPGSGSSARPSRPPSSRGPAVSRPASSRGSMTSLRSSRQGTPHARKSSMRHKRGVEFNHARKRSQSAKAGPRQVSQATVEVIQMEDAGQQGAHHRSVSPELPVRADGKYPMAKGAPMPKIKTKEPEEVFTEEELRHFSSNIAKDCDNAFRSSLIEEDSIAGSLGESERKHRGSPFTFSMESTPIMTPATEMSMKTWDSRPLPPLPSDKTLHSQMMTSPRLNSASAVTLVDLEDADNITEGVARIAVPIRVGQPGDRRVMSAPAQSHSNRRLATMPPINEDTTLNVVNHDKSRIVSAPPHTPRKRFNGQDQGMEYLTGVENSIRVVHSPTAISPVKVPSPLRVQKKSAATDGAGRHASQQQHSFNDEEGHGNQQSQDGGIVMKKKKKSWFKRTSRAESDGAVAALRDQYAAAEQDNGEYLEGPHGVPGKKKSFSFPFWKTGKSSELKMSTADNESSEKPVAPKESTVTKVENKRHSNASSHRTIEVKQNWLARLFRVKPATSYLCMTISRRRARQEVAILLREWRQYGIRGIQVDKQRNIVFARVGAKNYLNLKEVAFAAEIVTIIEHGKKQPLSIIRFTQERGAASSFHHVVRTMKLVFDSRNLLVRDRNKQKMMIKTLNS